MIDGAHKARILLVGIPAAFAESLRATMEHERYTVFMASGGQAALDFLREKRVDLILSGVSLQDESGVWLMESLRSASDNTPVMLTSGGENNDGISLVFLASLFLQQSQRKNVFLSELESFIK